MSKREINIRQSEIINKLKKHPSTFKEITTHLAQMSEIFGHELTVSDRTFQRDREDIFALYRIDIQCNKSKNEYFIAEDETEDNSGKRLLDSFVTFNMLNASIGNDNYIEFEQPADKGLENFHGILHALKQKLTLKITYQSFWSATTEIRTIEPYFLKEFKGLWYLVAKDVSKNAIRTFALDRMTSLEITKKKFVYPGSQQPKIYFKHCYGIISPDNQDEPILPIVLSFHPQQGKYVKALPLHHSQQILKDDETELIVELLVHQTFDFEMQLLSYGPFVQVLEPSTLREAIKGKLKEALKRY